MQKESTITNLVHRVLSGDRKGLARAISLAEDSPVTAARLLSEFRSQCNHCCRIGLTGPPGAGKSTLVAAMIPELKKAVRKIGAILVDPTSPITSGAILGDRIRLGDESLPDDVFIRSIASRGSLGGLSVSTSAAVRLIEYWGAERVIIETVGIGQQSTDVHWLADVVLLVLSPGVGDSIQTMKAGVLETADAYVINKTDLTGADQLALMLDAELSGIHAEKPTVFRTNARTGEGIDELVKWLESRWVNIDIVAGNSSRTSKAERELLFLIESILIDRLVNDPGFAKELSALVTEMNEDHINVFSAALKLANTFNCYKST